MSEPWATGVPWIDEVLAGEAGPYRITRWDEGVSRRKPPRWSWQDWEKWRAWWERSDFNTSS